jgi:hemolysin D
VAAPRVLAATASPIGQLQAQPVRAADDRSRMQVENKSVDLSPGMAVTTEITTGSRTVISYLLSPLIRYQHEVMRER